MRIYDVQQGSPEWLKLRADHRCASEAPAMMGLSKRTKRNELLRMKATGDEKEFSAWVQENLLARGHGVEAKARPIIEEIIGELFPITAGDDTGRYLASFDGTTMANTDGFEHKLWNAELAEAIRAGATEFPNGEEWQLEHQFLVNPELERIHFVCSDGTAEKMARMVYTRQPGRAARLVAGWAQFDEDVANYQHVEVIPAARGRTIPDLPAIFVQVTGKVKSSNLGEYEKTALEAIESINTTLSTDQDFADADKAIKFCADAETKLQEAKTRALAETVTIKELFETLNTLGEAMRSKRLTLNKLVEERKKTIRSDILRSGVDALAEHIVALNKRLGKAYMPTIPADFAGAMRAKKTIASLRDGVDTELARAKIAANAIADKIGINLNALRDAGAEYAFLFADAAQLLLKETDDFAILAKARIIEHKAKEEARLAGERERIRQEEAAKLAVAPPAPPILASSPAAKVMPMPRKTRPTDAEIITGVATYFSIHESRAVAWLMDMDLDAAIERVAAEPFTAQGA